MPLKTAVNPLAVSSVFVAMIPVGITVTKTATESQRVTRKRVQNLYIKLRRNTQITIYVQSEQILFNKTFVALIKYMYFFQNLKCCIYFYAIYIMLSHF